MFNVRKMTPEDFKFAVNLTDTMKWNLTEEDFKFMLNLEPEGCFTLLHGSEKVGITTTVYFNAKNPVGWIGNLIVEEKYRKRGGGRILAEHAINHLKKMGAKTIGLYSYKEQIGFYRKLGFKEEGEFTVLKGKVQFNPFKKTHVINGRNEMERIIAFDSQYFGASREKLLKKIAYEKEGNICQCIFEEGEVSGYVIAKVYGSSYAELGPLVCKVNRIEAASSLLGQVLERLKNFEASICISKNEENLLKTLFKAGLRKDFEVVRMFHGGKPVKECIYAAESLERG